MLDRIISSISEVKDPARCNELRIQLADYIEKQINSYKEKSDNEWNEELRRDYSVLRQTLEKTEDLEAFPSILSSIPEPPNMPPIPPNMPPPPSIGTKSDIKSNIIGNVTISQIQQARETLVRDTQEKTEERDGDVRND